VHTQGQKTCRQSSYISGVKKHFYNDVHAVLFGDSGFVEGGDSGGPMFHIDQNLTCGSSDDSAYICGILKGNHDSDGDSNYDDAVLGTTAETAEGRLGGNF